MRHPSRAGNMGSSTRLEPAEPVGEPQPPDDPERLDGDPKAQLGGAARPVEEEERQLLDARAVLLEAVVHLDLERVAVRADALEADPLEHRAADAAEAAGG